MLLLRDTSATIILKVSCHFRDFQINLYTCIIVNTLKFYLVYIKWSCCYLLGNNLIFYCFYLMLTEEYVLCTSWKSTNTLFKRESRLNIIRCHVWGCTRVVNAIQFGFSAITSRKKHRWTCHVTEKRTTETNSIKQRFIAEWQTMPKTRIGDHILNGNACNYIEQNHTQCTSITI